MLRVAICDDEKAIIEQVEKYIKNIETEKELQIMVEIGKYMSFSSLEYDLSEKRRFDIILMDIQFGKEDGIKVAEFVKSVSSHTAVIFMTGYHEKVYDVFSAHPTGFIRKPIDYDKFKTEFLRAVGECKRQEMYEYSSNRTKYKVLMNDIIYFKSSGRKVIIKLINEEREFYGKLDNVQAQVCEKSDYFYRISQSYLVNTNYVTSMKYDSLTIKVDSKEERFKITQDCRKNIKQNYMKNWEDEKGYTI